jgi:hypothetical protein
MHARAEFWRLHADTRNLPRPGFIRVAYVMPNPHSCVVWDESH